MTEKDTVYYGEDALKNIAQGLLAYVNGKPWEILIWDQDGEVWKEFPEESALDHIKLGRTIRAKYPNDL